MNEKFTAYITRYALSIGIVSQLVEYRGVGMVREVKESYPTYYHGKDWHRTREAAVERAEQMRKAKIASLEKQIKKLRALTFAPPKEV